MKHKQRMVVIYAFILVFLAGWTMPAYPAATYVESEAIVTFKEQAQLTAAQQTLRSHSLTLAKHYALLSAHRHKHTGLVRDTSRTTAALIAELSNDPLIETAEPNYLRWTSASQPPNDPLFPQLWALQNTGQAVLGSSGTAGADIKFLEAWSMARPTTGAVVVAVIDTGVNYTHPDLASNMWVNPGGIPGDTYVGDTYGYDFADGTADPTDSGDHGTHVSGTIAAVGNNLTGVIGVNSKAKIMALRVSSDGNTMSTSAIIEALQYATMMKNGGVNVVAINESYGGGDYSSAEKAANQAAGDAGIIVCVAAGNDSANNDTTPDYPASYRLANMLVVAASDQNDALAYFSNYGSNTVDLAAPGVNILSCKPTSVATTTAWVQRASATYSAMGLTYAGLTTGITAAVYDCGLGNIGDFPPAVHGNIALIKRGTLYFSAKVANAMAAGAVAAIIDNNVNGNFSGTLQYASNWIPAVAISLADGATLRAALPSSATVVNMTSASQLYQYMDGTSMATPHVVAAVTFAAMNFPGETVTQRMQRVLASVDSVAGLQGKVATGGRLNLARVVDANNNGLPDWWENDPTNSNQVSRIILLCNPTNAGNVSGDGFYLIGGQQQISVTALNGRTFTGWNDGNTSTPRTITVPATNITYTANFSAPPSVYLQDTTGMVTTWLLNNQGQLQQFGSLGNMGGWQLKAAGDVNGDGNADLFWQMASGWVVAWLSTPSNGYNGVGLGNLGAWELCAAADVDGDGIADLIWQHSSGWVSVWLMNTNGTPRTGYSLGNLGVWKLKGAGDINGDGKADLIWQSPMGDVVVWLSQPGGDYQGLGVGNLGAWELRAVHDLNGDGIADLLWENPGGWTVVWYMNSNGTVHAGAGLGNIGTAKIMAVE